jgi:hypothetical protein
LIKPRRLMRLVRFFRYPEHFHRLGELRESTLNLEKI